MKVEEDTGENRIMISPGANASVTSDSIPSHALDSSSTDLIVMQLEIPLETVLSIISRPDPRPPILLNPAPAVPLPESAYPRIEILIVNESEACLLTGVQFPDPPEVESYKSQASQAIDWFISKGARHIVITLGALGASFYDHTTKTKGHISAVPVEKVVDTTGAGDTFVGALAVVFVGSSPNKFGLEGAVQTASGAAAWSVAHRGTWAAMPLGSQVS